MRSARAGGGHGVGLGVVAERGHEEVVPDPPRQARERRYGRDEGNPGTLCDGTGSKCQAGVVEVPEGDKFRSSSISLVTARTNAERSLWLSAATNSTRVPRRPRALISAAARRVPTRPGESSDAQAARLAP
jgi:hypothetical protein